MFEKEIFNKKCKWLIVWKKWSFMLWEQGVEGSNPFAPTVENEKRNDPCRSFFSFLKPAFRLPLNQQ